jgi:hypothetical protein
LAIAAAILVPTARTLAIKAAVVLGLLTAAFYTGYHARGRICVADASRAKEQAHTIDTRAADQVEADETAVTKELAADDAKDAAQIKEIEDAKASRADRCRLDADGLRQLLGD